MATCQSFQHNFDKPLQDNPSLLESISWNHVKPATKPLEQSSATRILEELKLREKSVSSPTSSFPVYLLSSIEQTKRKDFGINRNSLSSTVTSSNISYHDKNDNFMSMNSERLQLCTEGLGFESLVVLKNELDDDWHDQENSNRITKRLPREHPSSDFRKPKTGVRVFPPPISSIGRNGKPSVCFKTYRKGDRFVLREIRVPSQELLHACREDGRLKLQFVHPEHETLDRDEEEENQYEGDEYIEDSQESDDDEDRYDSSTSYEAGSDVDNAANNYGDVEEEKRKRSNNSRNNVIVDNFLSSY